MSDVIHHKDKLRHPFTFHARALVILLFAW